MAETLGFPRLTMGGWCQSGEVDLDLTAKLTMLTGANGARKTTLVSLLGRYFNWASTFVGPFFGPSRDGSPTPPGCM